MIKYVIVGTGGGEGWVKQALEVRAMCRLSIDRSSLVAAAVVDRCGLVRGGVVHRRESVVDLVVNGFLQVRAWLT